MKTCIVRTRIPAAQAAGAVDISLPVGFGIPNAFIVYFMSNQSAYEAFDSTTTYPCFGVGFGGTGVAGIGLTNVSMYVGNAEVAIPTVSRSGTLTTCSVFVSDPTFAHKRSWKATSMIQDTITGQFTTAGTIEEPIDMLFTVFGGSGLQASVGFTSIHGVINLDTPVYNIGFQPDLLFMGHNRQAQTTDGNISFGAAHRSSGAGVTTVRANRAFSWRNQDNVNTSACTSYFSTSGTVNLATTFIARVKGFFSGGFAITAGSAQAGNTITYLALKSVSSDDFSVDTLYSRSATGTSIYGTGFKPQLITGMFTHNSGLNSIQSTAATGAECISVFSGTGISKRNHNGTGTITASTGSATITGTGTSFLEHIAPTDLIYNSSYNLLGTVSSVASDTSLTLTANSAANVTNGNYYFANSSQFSFSYGNVDGSASGNTALRAITSDSALLSFTATTPSIQNQGDILNMNGENLGFAIDWTTSNATPRLGWFVAFKDNEYNGNRTRIDYLS